MKPDPYSYWLALTILTWAALAQVAVSALSTAPRLPDPQAWVEALILALLVVMIGIVAAHRKYVTFAVLVVSAVTFFLVSSHQSSVYNAGKAVEAFSNQCASTDGSSLPAILSVERTEPISNTGCLFFQNDSSGFAYDPAGELDNVYPYIFSPSNGGAQRFIMDPR